MVDSSISPTAVGTRPLEGIDATLPAWFSIGLTASRNQLFLATDLPRFGPRNIPGYEEATKYERARPKK
jgi:hypothetical protein